LVCTRTELPSSGRTTDSGSPVVAGAIEPSSSSSRSYRSSPVYDHALLALDLVGVEAGVAEHVDEHVERDVARLGGALDVVAGQLLAGERVELAADRVDLGRDVTRGRPPLRALEEHVLGEVGDAALLAPLVARAGGEHHEARHRLRVVHRRRQHPCAV
jgi:hypothetical protein